MQVLATPLEDTTDDSLYRGRVLLRQPKGGYRFGSDAALLAACLRADSGQTIVDMGCGVGALMLGAAVRLPSVRFIGIEREPVYAALASHNILHNKLQDRVTVIQGDVRSEDLQSLYGTIDHVVANPPYFGLNTHSPAQKPLRAVARQEQDTKIADWLRVASRFLREGGTITMIYPMDRLAEWQNAAEGLVGGITVFPLIPKEGRPAKRVLLRAVKGSDAPMMLAKKDFILHRQDGSLTEEASAIIDHGNYLDLG